MSLFDFDFGESYFELGCSQCYALACVADVTEQWVGGVDFKLVVLQQRCHSDEQLFLCYGLSGT